MQTPSMAHDVHSPAVITHHDGSRVVSVAALLARLDLVDQWEDLDEVRDVLRTIVGGEPRLGADRKVRKEFRQGQAESWAAMKAALEEWSRATDPDQGDVDGERRRVLMVERRRLRRNKIGRWDQLRIRFDGYATGTLEGRVATDDHADAWTYVSRLESQDLDMTRARDQVIRGLLKDAEDDGYDPNQVHIELEG